jgi:hypothetical protein
MIIAHGASRPEIPITAMALLSVIFVLQDASDLPIVRRPKSSWFLWLIKLRMFNLGA